MLWNMFKLLNPQAGDFRYAVLCHEKICIHRSVGSPTFRTIDAAQGRSQVSNYNDKLLYVFQ